jgi:hypothetical protein
MRESEGVTMGYCPRCGENSAFGAAPEDRSALTASEPLRIPVDSKIVHLPDMPNEAEITFGGSRFRVRRSGDSYLLRPLE